MCGKVFVVRLADFAATQHCCVDLSDWEKKKRRKKSIMANNVYIVDISDIRKWLR